MGVCVIILIFANKLFDSGKYYIIIKKNTFYRMSMYHYLPIENGML
jgi:hypothetical protein